MNIVLTGKGMIFFMDDDGQCRPCDAHPPGARRRLAQEAFILIDRDDGQRFKRKGERVVPIFDKPIRWSTAAGFEAAKLLLSCLGRPDEYTLWRQDHPMTVDEWQSQGLSLIHI